MAERRRPRRARLPAPLARAMRPVHDPQADLQRWRLRIQRARQLREEWAAMYKVDLLAQTYNGDLANADEDTALIINRFWPTIKAQQAGLLAQTPTYFVRATGKDATQIAYDRAASSEATLAAIARQDEHLVQEADLGLQQSFWAIGVLKCLYDPRLEPNPQRRQPMYVLDDAGAPMTDPQTGAPIPLVDPRTQQPMTQPDKVLTDEVYRWQWVNWHNMLLPDEGPAMLRWTWLGEEVEVSVEEAKDDDRFPKALRDQLVPTRKPRVEGDSLLTPLMEPHELDRTLWYAECWDLKTKRHIIYAENQVFSQTHLLLDEELPDGVEDHPYSILPGYTAKTDPDPSPWPIPHVWNWLTMQREYNLRREQMMNAAKRSARKIYYDPNTFPDAEAATAALQSNVDMAGVEINDINKPPVVLTDPGSTPDIARDLLALEKDWLNVTGTPGERIGNPSSGDTATQAIIADRSATLREGRMKDRVVLWLGTAGKKMLQLVQGTMTLGTWVKIRDWTDPEVQEYLRTRFGAAAALALQESPGLKQLLIERYGREKWTEVTRETLQFEADVGVIPGSMRGRTPEQDRQQTLLFLQALAQVGTVLPPLLTSRKFVTRVAELFELGDPLLVDEIIQAVTHGIQQGMVGRPAGPRNGTSPPPTAGQVTQQPFMGSRLQTLLMNAGG